MKRLSLGIAFVLALCGPVSAQPVATPQPSASPVATVPWLDPFCAASVTARPIDTAPASQPLNASSEILSLGMWAESGSSLDAHVTLLTDTEAYDVILNGVAVMDDGKGLRSRNLLVQLPKPMLVRFAYLDSYSVDGGKEVSCPAEPFEVSKIKPLRLPPPPAEVPRFNAVFKQVLPPLPCGTLFSNPEVAKISEPVYPLSYFDHNRSVQIEIFLDSNGDVVKTSVYKSSGLQAFDKSATEAALRTQYKPAMLLCAPVVGSYLFRASLIN